MTDRLPVPRFDPSGYPQPRPRVTGRGVVAVGSAVWLGLLVVPVVAAMTVVAPDGHGIPSGDAPALWALVVVAAAATVAEGAVLARARMPWAIPIASVVGTGALLVLYVADMTAVHPDDKGSSDIAAGAGVVILGLPTLIVLTILIGVGFAASLLIRWFRGRSRRRRT